ncbi:MAG TPA: LuxR C-terminal-related transcriptional regulator [Pseudonocardiaceae bacterium]|nr:LuxR C-terminal-related transcriptional regulator [Pseudonocardiaceae bacterium]
MVRQAELFAQLGAILGSSASREERAAEILDRLHDVVPYVAASVSAMKAGTVEHVSLANHGYSSTVEQHLNSWFVRNDPAYLSMRRVEGLPLRWRDAPDYRQSYSAQQVFLPAGFDEGVTVCMRDRRGFYTGSLHLSVDDRRHPTDTAVKFLGHLRVMLGELTNLGTTPPAAPPAERTIVITPSGCRRSGTVNPLPEPIIRQVRSLAAADALPSWFWWRSSCGEVRLVTTERIGDEIVVGDIPANLPYGLSIRELEVLTLIVGGFTNVQIAHRLLIAPKTVAKHIEHVLGKLGVRSRTEAAVRATRIGLVLLTPSQPLPPR